MQFLEAIISFCNQSVHKSQSYSLKQIVLQYFLVFIMHNFLISFVLYTFSKFGGTWLNSFNHISISQAIQMLSEAHINRHRYCIYIHKPCRKISLRFQNVNGDLVKTPFWNQYLPLGYKLAGRVKYLRKSLFS